MAGAVTGGIVAISATSAISGDVEIGNTVTSKNGAISITAAGPTLTVDNSVAISAGTQWLPPAANHSH